MVTRIHKHVRGRAFLKEHREAARPPVSAEAMAGRLGIERESVYRLERKAAQGIFSSRTLYGYAQALEIEPAALLRPPGGVSLDAMVSSASPDVQSMAADIVSRLVARRG